MAISLECDCGKRLKVADTAAGKRVRCPGCEQVLHVPNAIVSSSGPADESDDFGDLDFDELAELERASAAADEEFQVQCPKCQQLFSVRAASRQERTTCTGCGAAWRIGDHERTGRLALDGGGGYRAASTATAAPRSSAAAASAADMCTECGAPIEPGDVLCDNCAGNMAGAVAAKHEVEAQKFRGEVLEKSGVIQAWHVIVAIVATLVGGIAAGIVRFALMNQ